MALKPLKAKRLSTKKRKPINVALSGAAAMRAMGETPAGQISAKSIAEEKGFKLPDLQDLASTAMPVVEAVTDTLAAPQRNVVSLVQNDGLVNPYSKAAEDYDPSDALGKDGLAGFALDVVLDPINIVPGAGIAKTAIKEGAKGVNIGLRAARAAIEDPAQAGMRSLKQELRQGIQRERGDITQTNARANKLLAIDRRAGTQDRADYNINRLRSKQSAAAAEQGRNSERLKAIQSGQNNQPSKGFQSLEDEVEALERANRRLGAKHKSLEKEVQNIRASRKQASREGFNLDLIDARQAKKKAAKRRSELDKQEREINTKSAQEEFAKQDRIGQLVDQTLAPEVSGSMIYLRPQFTNKRIPIAAFKSERIAKGLEKAGKIPGLTKAANVLGKSFDTNYQSNKLVIEGGRGTLAAGASDAQRIVNPVARKVDKMSKTDYQRTNDIFTALYEKGDIDGAAPDTWRAAQKEAQQKASYQRQQAATAKSEAGRAQMLKRADELQDVADSAKLAADNWAKLSKNSKEVYQDIRKYYDEEAKIKIASGEIVGTRANYVPSFETAKDGREMMPYRKEKTRLTEKDQSQLEKLREGLPEEFDFFDSYRAAVSGITHARYNKVLARSVADRFGRDTNPGEGWVEFAIGGSATKEKVWIPKEIDESLTNLIKLGTSGRSQNELIRGFQKGVSKWKVLAYSINPGHFLVDTIGDLWNTSLRLGLAVVNPDRMSRVIPIQRNVEKYFRAMEKADYATARKLAVQKVKLGGHEYTVRELADGIEFASIRDTGYSVADIGDYNPRALAQLRNWHPFRAGSSAMQVAGNKRDNLSKRLAYLLAVDVRGKATKAKGNALLEAGRDVRISLFDYSELTPFEKSVARNAVPFYTWTRKNVPFQLRSIAERPQMTIAPFKLQDNLQKRETNEDYLIPDYMRERYLRIGELPEPLRKLVGQKKGQPFYLNPVIPSFDLAFLQGGMRGVDLSQGLGMLNPMIKAPFELTTERSIGTGAPIEGSVFSTKNDKGLPFLGRKGEYAVKTFLGQPGSVTVNTADETREEANRIFPGIGMVTGVRGATIDPAKQQERAEAQLRDEQRARIQYLQDIGAIPTADEIAALQQRNQFPNLGIPRTRRRIQMKAFGE